MLCIITVKKKKLKLEEPDRTRSRNRRAKGSTLLSQVAAETPRKLSKRGRQGRARENRGLLAAACA